MVDFSFFLSAEAGKRFAKDYKRFQIKYQNLPLSFGDFTGTQQATVNTADFNELSEVEKRHFYKCSRCGEMVDRRQLDDVLFHETDHKPRPDIQYGGSEEI